MIKTIVIVIIVCIVSMQCTYGQVSMQNRSLSPQDSARLTKYVDSASAARPFSQKKQRYLDSALAITPWRAAWWQQKAMPLFKEKKYEIGLPYLDSAVKYDARKYIDYRAFMKCIYQKSYSSAIADFHAAKAIIGAGSVMDHTYDFYLGLCYLQLNRLDSAEYYLLLTTNEQRTSLGEKYVHPLDLFYLGIVYYEKESFSRAIEVFDNSLKLYTNFSDAKYYKACCLGRLNRMDEAKALVAEAGNDFSQGYTINEDNVNFEAYPYQLNKFYFK